MESALAPPWGRPGQTLPAQHCVLGVEHATSTGLGPASTPTPGTGGKQRKARRGRSPTSLKGKERAGGEQGPARGSSSPPDGGDAPAPVERVSPLHAPPTTLGNAGHLTVPSTLEAFQAAKAILFLLVPPTPATEVPCLRDKPASGPFQLSPERGTAPHLRVCPASARPCRATRPWTGQSSRRRSPDSRQRPSGARQRSAVGGRRPAEAAAPVPTASVQGAPEPASSLSPAAGRRSVVTGRCGRGINPQDGRLLAPARWSNAAHYAAGIDCGVTVADLPNAAVGHRDCSIESHHPCSDPQWRSGVGTDRTGVGRWPQHWPGPADMYPPPQAPPVRNRACPWARATHWGPQRSPQDHQQ